MSGAGTRFTAHARGCNPDRHQLERRLSRSRKPRSELPPSLEQNVEDTMERCLACKGLLIDGDEVYDDVSGETIHAKCCGPERESYVGPDGEPLKEDAPIPKPWIWGASQS